MADLDTRQDLTEAGSSDPENDREVVQTGTPASPGQPTEAEPGDAKPEPDVSASARVEPDVPVHAEPDIPAQAVRRWSALVGGLAVLLVALLVGGALLFVHNRNTSQVDAQRPIALAAARQVALDITTIGADNAPRQVAALTAESTGAFRDQIAGYSSMVQAALRQSNAASKGAVTAAGLERIESDTASALVTVAAKVSSSQRPEGQESSYRLSIQLQRTGDRWLASVVDFVR